MPPFRVSTLKGIYYMADAPGPGGSSIMDDNYLVRWLINWRPIGHMSPRYLWLYYRMALHSNKWKWFYCSVPFSIWIWKGTCVVPIGSLIICLYWYINSIMHLGLLLYYPSNRLLYRSPRAFLFWIYKYHTSSMGEYALANIIKSTSTNTFTNQFFFCSMDLCCITLSLAF